MPDTTYFSVCPSPVGSLLLLSNGRALTGLYMEDQRHGLTFNPAWTRDDALLAPAREQLAAYFAGELTEFDLPLAPEGTPFQRDVWKQLRAIPYGCTISYGELARRVGKPSASRAVGAANGRNPLGVIVPCHRVIGANGSLTGYGGGLDRKKQLLGLEAEVLARRGQRLL